MRTPIWWNHGLALKCCAYRLSMNIRPRPRPCITTCPEPSQAVDAHQQTHGNHEDRTGKLYRSDVSATAPSVSLSTAIAIPIQLGSHDSCFIESEKEDSPCRSTPTSPEQAVWQWRRAVLAAQRSRRPAFTSHAARERHLACGRSLHSSVTMMQVARDFKEMECGQRPLC